MNRKSQVRIAALGTLALILTVQGCQSGGTDGGVVSNKDQYTPGNEGGIDLVLTEGDHLGVGEVQGFRVYAKDQNGGPASNVAVICDTEKGLAIIEPTSGLEHTDSAGQMSGQIGCENTGSLLMACRLQGASNKRMSQTIICEGPIPLDFGGFPGAGGGGLGGGKTEPGRVGISEVSINDGGSSISSSTSSTAIDIVHSVCDSGGTPTSEPFYDTHATFTVVNDSSYRITFTSLKYSVSGANGSSGGSYTSPLIQINGDATADSNGGSTDITSLIFDASGSGKRFYGSSSNITIPGFRNITFTLTGIDELGNTVTLTTSTSLSFDNYNNCGDS